MDYLESAWPMEQGGTLMVREIGNAYSSETVEQPEQVIPKIEALLKKLEEPSQKVVATYALAVLYRSSGQLEKVVDGLKPIIEGEQANRPHIHVCFMYLESLHELRGLAIAYQEGLRTLQKWPDLVGIKDRLAWWAAELGAFEEASRHLEDFLSYTSCSSCTRRALKRYAFQMYFAGKLKEACLACERVRSVFEAGEKDPELDFLELTIRDAEGKPVSPRKFNDTLRQWRSIETAPIWALETTACAFIHADDSETGFELLKVISERTKSSPWPEFLSHALELLVRLHNQENSALREVEVWLVSLGLPPDVIAKEFRELMPRLARQQKLRPHVLAVYQNLRALRLLSDDIPPYSTAIATMEAEDPEKALMVHPPELREAISLLISPGQVRGSSPPSTRSGQVRRRK